MESILLAIGTFIASFVALFRDWLRRGWFRPKLEVSLDEESGELTTARNETFEGNKMRVQHTPIRYYHLRVDNKARRRWPPATKVQLVIQRVEEPGPDDEWITKWSSGPCPLTPRSPEVTPLFATVGPPAYYDFFSISEYKEFILRTLITPNNLPAKFKDQKVKLAVTVQALSVEADSAPKRFVIVWDGQWHSGKTEMGQHVSIKECSA